MAFEGKILLTGASGFVGGRLASCLHNGGYNFVAASRSRQNLPYATGIITSLIDDKCISSLLTDVSVVIHAAARAHIMRDEAADPLAEYRRVNVDGTFNLAKQAASAGVKETLKKTS